MARVIVPTIWKKKIFHENSSYISNKFVFLYSIIDSYTDIPMMPETI